MSNSKDNEAGLKDKARLKKEAEHHKDVANKRYAELQKMASYEQS